MSTFVFGSRDHGPLCRQRDGHPPVLCGCRTLPVQPLPAGKRLDTDIEHTRVSRAIRAFFRPIEIDRNAA